jgi:2,4-dihydroxyhept-2-ene-1,7-dioic acid aldolase
VKRESSNPFKRALASGQPQYGIWSASCNATVAEIIAGAGFDWVLFDAEHAPNTSATLLDQIRAMGAAQATAIVRPTSNDKVPVQTVLDLGFMNVLIPYVEDAEQAARAVSYTRYPTLGVRGVSGGQRANGYGRDRGYAERSQSSIAVIAQIESRLGVQNLEAIAKVDGIDAIFVGPGDLAADLGHLGKPMSDPVQSVIADIGQRVRKLNCVAGIAASSPEDARRYVQMGFALVTVCSDLALLRDGMQAALELARRGN